MSSADGMMREAWMLRRAACGSLVVLLLGSCASRIPATGFAEPAAIESAITRYYERNGSEENQTCLTPYIDGLTRTAVVDEQPDRLVLDVHYFYRDRFKSDNDNGIGRECTGFRAREFTLAKGPDGIAVVAMGESRR
jgi:hypothetical protein